MTAGNLLPSTFWRLVLRWRVPVLATVVLGGTAAGVVAAWMPERFGLLIGVPVALMCLALVVLRQPELAPTLLVACALTVRFTLSTGTQSRIVASMLLTAALTGIWLFRAGILRRLPLLIPSSVNAPLLIFVVMTLFSYGWSVATRDPLLYVWSTWPMVQAGALATMLLLPAALLLTANTLSKPRGLGWLVGTVLAGGTAALISDLLGVALPFLQVRPLFPTWFASLLVALALFHRGLRPAVRALLLILACLQAYRMVTLQFTWLSAWLPTLLGLLTIVLLRSRIALVIMLAFVLLLTAGNVDWLAEQYVREREESGDTRLQAYTVNWQVTGGRLLFGLGPAGYAVYYMTYLPDQAMATHSNYLDVFSQTGLVGLAAFLAMFAAILHTAVALYRRVRARGDLLSGFSAALLGGLLATLVAMALGDWVLPFAYTQTIAGFDYALYTWVMLGAGVAVWRMADNEEWAAA